MVVCNFFLQGRCRYGDRCWNEHPGRGGGGGGGGGGRGGGGGGRGGGGGGHQYHQQPQQNYQGNRGGWNTQSDRYTSGAQSQNIYKWAPQGSNRDSGKTNFGSQSGFGTQARSISPKNSSASGFSFSQNKFSALSSAEDGDNQRDEEADTIDAVITDMESWESSGQWMLSAYSFSKEKPNVSGFEDISPEELRLECYGSRADGNLQNYVNVVQQLALKWRSRLNELKNPTSVKAALISELKKPFGDTKPVFGSGGQPTPTFASASFPTSSAASSSVSDFSFKPQSNFANTAGEAIGSFGGSSTTPLAFPSAPASHGTAGFGSTSSSASLSFGFGSAAPSVFGVTGFSGFSAPSTNTVAPPTNSVATGFGTLHSSAASPMAFGSVGANAGSSILGQPPGQLISGAGSNIPKAATTISASTLFTPLNELSAEELKQFQAKKFTLGRIPLKPPPTELLM